jgi:cytochrome b
MEEGGAPRRIRLWDLPVRIVHWSFVLLIPALWWTWKHDRLALHETLGYVLLALLLFRLFWGFWGSGAARFRSFVRGPRAVLAYLTGKGRTPILGHNPLGGWSVLALLALMLAEVAVGLFTQDTDGIESGPLTHLVSYEQADAARTWHGLAFDLILVLVAIHVAAILFYLLVKRDNLVGPMVTGRKSVGASQAEPASAPAWRIAAAAAAAGLIAFWVSKGCPV